MTMYRLSLFAFSLSLWLGFTTKLIAQPLALTLDVSVANAEKPEDQISQIPTQFELQRADGSVDLNDPNKLYLAFKRVHGPTQLYQAKPDEKNPNVDFNPKLSNYPLNLPDLSLKSSAISDLKLRGTGFPTFQTYSMIQTALLIRELCKFDREKNKAECKINFPSVQVASSKLSNISSIRFRVFKHGKANVALDQALPNDALLKLQEHLKENSRRVEEGKDNEREGYFLYANFHFEATLEEANEGMMNDKTYEWRYALKQAPGRLALLPGDYWLERETLLSDGKKEFHVALAKLAWGSFKGLSDLNWTKVDDPREYRP